MQGRADGKFVVVHFFMIDNVFKRLDNVAVNVAMTQQISLLHVNSIAIHPVIYNISIHDLVARFKTNSNQIFRQITA